jgi:hypothetical protein
MTRKARGKGMRTGEVFSQSEDKNSNRTKRGRRTRIARERGQSKGGPRIWVWRLRLLY